jgi:hypothetical protein
MCAEVLILMGSLEVREHLGGHGLRWSSLTRTEGSFTHGFS